MQPKAQGWQAKLETKNRGHLQPLSGNTSAVSGLSMEGLSPIAIPRTCILSLEEGCLNNHASRISAFLKRSYYLKKSHYPLEMVDLSLLCSLLRGRVFSQGQGWCPSALCLYYL